MSRGFNPFVVWSQVPVANRTVEVNTKTGFSLTAGSYVVRASSSQRATAAFANGGTTVSILISSVTTTRATATGNGTGDSGGITASHGSPVYVQLTAATTVTATRGSGTDAGGVNRVGTGAVEVVELF